MYHLIWFFIIQLMCVNIFANIVGPTDNATFKDMYVIKATTYQVGILTNDTRINDNVTGEQVAITFYSKNGSDIDLNKISPPLLTNVTGERMVAVAPITNLNTSSVQPWMYFNDIIYGNKSTSDNMHNSVDKMEIENRDPRQIVARSNKPSSEYDDCRDYECRSEEDNVYKRSVENQSDINIMKSAEPIVQFIEGSAIIPQNDSINALYLPPLLKLQSNLSVLPVPIPNTSKVHYSKMDTIVKSTQT